MKAELPPLRFPVLWLCVSSSSSPNCFSLSLSISASFNHSRCVTVSVSPSSSAPSINTHSPTVSFSSAGCRTRSPKDALNRLYVASSVCLLHFTHACISSDVGTIYGLCGVTVMQNPVPILMARNWLSENYTHTQSSRHVNSFHFTPEFQSVCSVFNPRGNTIFNQPERKLSEDEICFSSLYLWAAQGFTACLSLYFAKR